jgi:tight adherence protein B
MNLNLDFNELWVISALAFGAALLGVQGLYLLLFRARREKNAVNRRLMLGSRMSNANEVLETLRRERGVDFLTRTGLLPDFNLVVIQSGLRVSATGLLLSAAGIAVVLFLLFKLAFGSEILALVIAAPLSLAAVYGYLRRARGKRIAAFSEQFPDALDVIVRGLRAGHPFRVALGLVAREMPDPVGSEFGVTADEIMFGLEQATAIDNLCQRVGQDDLSFFATAVTIQHQTGGNLAEILSRLSRLVRNRAKLRLKIRALSAEGRASAIALSLAPFILFGIITLISPQYFGAVKDHPAILPAAVLGLLLLIVGNIVMYRMVNFKF